MKPVSRNTASISISAIKRIELLARSKKDVISLAQGIPYFETAQNIKNAAKKAIDENLVGKYTAGFGIEPLRIAIAKKVTRENNIPTNPSQVIVTHGAIEALMAIFLALLDTNDEIIIPTPDYATHLTQVLIATHGRKAIQVPLEETETGWKLNGKKLEQAITKNTKAILICNPSNPIGKVYSKEELKDIARIAKKHDLYIITDEMYEHFLFDGKKHVSIGSFPEVKDRTISIFGVSKSYAMTGWRIGYIVASKPLINEIFKVHDSIITCPAAVSQYAALEAITGPQSMVSEYKKVFEKHRKLVMDAFSTCENITCGMPEGGYYAFPKIKGVFDDEKLAQDLIEKAKVALVPGSAFGKGGKGHLRLSFGCTKENLQEGLTRFTAYIQKLHLRGVTS